MENAPDPDLSDDELEDDPPRGTLAGGKPLRPPRPSDDADADADADSAE